MGALLGHARPRPHPLPPTLRGRGGRACRRPPPAHRRHRRPSETIFRRLFRRGVPSSPLPSRLPQGNGCARLGPSGSLGLKGGALAVFDAACCCRERRGCGLMLARAAFTIFPPVVMVVRADLSRIEGGIGRGPQGRCGTTVLR